MIKNFMDYPQWKITDTVLIGNALLVGISVASISSYIVSYCQNKPLFTFSSHTETEHRSRDSHS